MAEPYINGHRGKPTPKKQLTMLAEPEFFDALDTLCKAEKPIISRSMMLRRLVFEKAQPLRRNGHKSAARVGVPA